MVREGLGARVAAGRCKHVRQHLLQELQVRLLVKRLQGDRQGKFQVKNNTMITIPGCMQSHSSLKIRSLSLKEQKGGLRQSFPEIAL